MITSKKFESQHELQDPAGSGHMGSMFRGSSDAALRLSFYRTKKIERMHLKSECIIDPHDPNSCNKCALLFLHQKSTYAS